MRLTTLMKPGVLRKVSRLFLVVLCLGGMVSQAFAEHFLVIRRKPSAASSAAAATTSKLAASVRRSTSIAQVQANRQEYTHSLEEQTAGLAAIIEKKQEEVFEKLGKKVSQHPLRTTEAIEIEASSIETVKAAYSETEWEIVKGQPFFLDDVEPDPISDRPLGAASISSVGGKSLPWGVVRVKAPDAWKRFKTQGKGIVVAVIDTGVDSTHSEFKGRIKPGRSFVTAESTTEDLNGHGTHVAGTVGGKSFGVAPEVTIMPIKVLDRRGSGNETSVISAIDYAITQNVDVINLSLRTPFNLGINDAGSKLGQLYTTVLDKARKAGIVVVAAAGNDGEFETIGLPGRRAGVVTVAALTKNGRRASFSQRGSNSPKPSPAKPDIGAPGVDIRSARPSGSGKSPVDSGTSMASPHVAGTVALMLAAAESKTLKLDDDDAQKRIRDALAESATALSEPKTDVGDGLLDALNAVATFLNEETEEGDTNTVPDTDNLAKIKKRHEAQMARLETVETDLRANLERLRTRRKKDSDGKKNGETEKKPTEENTLEGALEAYLSSASVGAASADQNSARFNKLATVLRAEIDKSVAEKTAGMAKQLEANSKALNSVATKSDISRLEQQLKSLSDSLGKFEDGNKDSGKSSARTRPSGTTLQNIQNR